MPKEKKTVYFDVKEEEAVIEFITAKTQQERDKIFREKLYKPFSTLVESIINRYKLHRVNITYEENFCDTLSHLIQQAGMFKPEQNTKAYSYYGTICRNYLIGEIRKDNNKIKNNQDFDISVPKLENEHNYSYEIEDEGIKVNDLIDNLVSEIKVVLENNKDSKRKLNENEINLGNALIDILTQRHLFFDEESRSTKFDKITIISTLRAYTNLSTKDIRVALNKYKVLYKSIKNNMINDGSI